MYMAKREMIQEYENVILNNQKSFSHYYFTEDPVINQDIALAAFHYAFEVILHYDPHTLKERINIELLKTMRLYNLYMKYIVFPSELAKSRDVWYVCHLMYPEIFPNGIRENTIQMYSSLMSGHIKKFPKHVFDGNEGKIKACICLQYAINKYLSFTDIDELYDFFSQEGIMNFLKRIKLDGVCVVNYSFPIDFLHDSLPSMQKNEELYKYARAAVKNRSIQKTLKNSDNNKLIKFEYKKIVNEEVTEEEKESCERELFSTMKSEINTYLCLNELLHIKLKDLDIDELYGFFSEPSEIKEFLDKYLLLKQCNRFFETPVDFLHHTLPENKRDIICFNYAKKMYLRKEQTNA